MITVTYIAAPSEEGRDLFSKVKPVIESTIHEQFRENVEWVCINHPDYPEGLISTLPQKQELALKCCLFADLVIFDGSIDSSFCFKHNADDTSSGCCSQYEYATFLMKVLDYVLIVSRTKLPYNFEGLRKGGAPNWIRSRIVKKDGIFLADDGTRTNAYIVKWIKETLPFIEFPRKNKPENLEFSFSNMKEINQLETGMINASMDKVDKEYENDIFVSYLSKESRFRNAHPSIEDVLLDYSEIVPDGHFIYAPPGDLSNEIMTERRRWEIVSSIDRQMSKCKAVVLYQTDDYGKSWWTTAEILSLAYRIRSGSSKNLIYILERKNGTFSVRKLQTAEEIQTFLPRLTEEQYTALTRMFTHSDPLTNSYEYDDIPIAEAPKFVKNLAAVFAAGGVKLMGHWGIFESPSLLDNFKQARASLDSHVKTPQFRKGLVFDTSRSDDYTVDDFLNLRSSYKAKPELYDYLQAYFSDNPKATLSLALPNKMAVRLKKTGEYYRFYQPRMGKVLNKEGWLVKPIVELELDDSDAEVPI